MKRRPLLLLEMMIAFLIMGGAITMLFTGFLDAIRAKNIIRQEKEQIMASLRLKLRLAQLFKDVIDVKEISSNAFFIKYKGGIDHDPNFRLEMESILQAQNKVLTLVSWPENGPPRCEVLSENVETIYFEFFNEIEGQFKKEYPQQKPSMMRVTITPKMVLPIFL
jgi:type II secretory pathway pseudopilin PulG